MRREWRMASENFTWGSGQYWFYPPISVFRLYRTMCAKHEIRATQKSDGPASVCTVWPVCWGLPVWRGYWRSQQSMDISRHKRLVWAPIGEHGPFRRRYHHRCSVANDLLPLATIGAPRRLSSPPPLVSAWLGVRCARMDFCC